MDGIANLTAIVEQEVAWYANARSWKAQLFYIEDEKHQIFTVVAVPDQDHPSTKNTHVVVMARIVDDIVMIDEDRTDRPLFESLVEAGIPREKIVVAYAGEKLESEASNP